MAWVYILTGSTGRHYIGSTVDLQARLAQHQRGHTYTTRRIGTFTLAAAREYATLEQARQVERLLKSKKNPRSAMFYLQHATE
jgi:putative endonuclease